MFTLVVYTVFMKRHSHGEEEVWCRCCQSQSGAVVRISWLPQRWFMAHGIQNLFLLRHKRTKEYLVSLR